MGGYFEYLKLLRICDAGGASNKHGRRELQNYHGQCIVPLVTASLA